MEDQPTKLLFVCLGNICRSPTGEGVMRHIVEREGVSDRFVIDITSLAARSRWFSSLRHRGITQALPAGAAPLRLRAIAIYSGCAVSLNDCSSSSISSRR